MKYAPILALLISLAWQGNVRAQDDYAEDLYLILSPFDSADAKRADAGFNLTFRAWMPSEGWKLAVDKVDGPEKNAVDLYMTLTAPTGPAAHGLTALDACAQVPELSVGNYDVNIHWRRPGGNYALRALYIFHASKYGKTDPPAGTVADTGHLKDASLLGGARRHGARVIRGKGAAPKFELAATIGTHYDNLKLKLDKFEKPDAQGRMEAWVTCQDEHKDGVRPCVCGFATVEIALGRLMRGTYVCNIQYRSDEEGEYWPSLRALLSTDKPLMPELSPITQDGQLPPDEARRTPLWQPPKTDGAWAGNARLVHSAMRYIGLQRPDEENPDWALQLRHEVAAGSQLQLESLTADAERKSVELQLRVQDQPETPPEGDGGRLDVQLPQLEAGTYRVAIWMQDGSGDYRLASCRDLVIERENVLDDEFATGRLAAPPARITLQGREDSKDTLNAGKGEPAEFTLETGFQLRAYQGSPKLVKVEKPDANGVIRVRVSISFDKSGKGEANREERLAIKLDKLRGGHYRIELQVKQGDGEYGLDRAIWFEATP